MTGSEHPPADTPLRRFQRSLRSGGAGLTALALVLGVVAAVDLEREISSEDTHQQTAGTLMREAPTVRSGDSLEDAVNALGGTDDEGLPVLDEGGDRVVGWVSHRDLLRAYRLRVGGRRCALSRRRG